MLADLRHALALPALPLDLSSTSLLLATSTLLFSFLIAYLLAYSYHTESRSISISSSSSAQKYLQRHAGFSLTHSWTPLEHHVEASHHKVWCNACAHDIDSSQAGVECLVCRQCSHTKSDCLSKLVRQPCKIIAVAKPADSSKTRSPLFSRTAGWSPKPQGNKASPPSPVASRLPNSASSSSLPPPLGVDHLHPDSAHTLDASSPDSHAQHPPDPFSHQWIIGNVGLSSSKCTICRIPTGDEFNLQDLRCIWCLETIHTRCLPRDPLGGCRMSRLPKLLLHPSHVVLEPSGQFEGPRSVPPKVGLLKTRPRFRVALPLDAHPLICLVNPKSGAQDAPRLLRALYSHLNPIQIVNLSTHSPESELKNYGASLPQCQILVCGGDGTVGWILSILDRMIPDENQRPPIAVLPLGTGNDLARVLGWGGGWEGESVLDILREIQAAGRSDLDRWAVRIQSAVAQAGSGRRSSIVQRAMSMAAPGAPKEKLSMMNNYLSIGSDATIVLEFHRTREKKPELFRSRFLNKIWYFLIGSKQTFKGAVSILSNPASPFVSPSVSRQPSSSMLATTAATTETHSPNPLSNFTLSIDGSVVSVPKSASSVILLNIPSYAGGARIYEAAELQGYPPCRMDDGFLEVIAVSGPLHMGASIVGLSSPAVLGRGRTFEMSVRCTKASPVDCQIDGEPFRVEQDSTFSVTRGGVGTMLRRSVVDTEDEHGDDFDPDETEDFDEDDLTGMESVLDDETADER
ncbi:ATP-NAD kinase-like domain-containing protein [Polychytrium aggregatum]|uniref:ATP-NAD kinase-like domain-containing protein n=1 Tax=Polychytrium aggregatum TaxID=110093 RepID=UPI0022FE4B4F|nr:ATP-NAD kinase-like domain-containing protein [Polychytrium aggregatum]KAI9206834.1 ATP-NAD kinase-like domain-containing protein [Polychytrium aggregatum]